MTDEEIERQIDENVTAERAHLMIKSIACALWGTDADHDWNADTIGAIADVLLTHGFRVSPGPCEKCGHKCPEHEVCSKCGSDPMEYGDKLCADCDSAR